MKLKSLNLQLPTYLDSDRRLLIGCLFQSKYFDMDNNMHEIHQEVQVWLEQIFGGESVPQYELNHRTLSILHELMKHNKTNDKDTQLIVEDQNQKGEDYGAEAKRIGKIMEGIKLTPAKLSQSGITNLRTLANLALLLQIKDTTDSSFYLGLQHLHNKHRKIEEERHSEHKLISQLFDKTRTYLIKYNSLHKALKALEDQREIQKPKLEAHITEAGFLKNKALEYRKLILKNEAHLAKLNVTPEIYHKTLVQKSQDLQVLQQKITPLKTKLQSYHDLPPDMLQAKVKVEEMRRQVALMEEEFTSKINMMHFVS